MLVIYSFNKPTFTDVKIMTEDGSTYTAHVIQPRMTVPDTGEVIPIIKTESTQGYLYNSNTWQAKDAYRRLGVLHNREVIFGKVIEIIKPKS